MSSMTHKGQVIFHLLQFVREKRATITTYCDTASGNVIGVAFTIQFPDSSVLTERDLVEALEIYKAQENYINEAGEYMPPREDEG